MLYLKIIQICFGMLRGISVRNQSGLFSGTQRVKTQIGNPKRSEVRGADGMAAAQHPHDASTGSVKRSLFRPDTVQPSSATRYCGGNFMNWGFTVLDC